MNVQELIDKLEDIQDKGREVVYCTPDGYIVVERVDICSWSCALTLSAND